MAATPSLLDYDRPLTYDDLLDLPDDGHRREIINGELIRHPSPTVEHQRVVGQMLRLLDDHTQHSGAGELLPGPFDVRLGRHDVVQPDLLVVLGSRLRVPNDHTSITHPPGVIVEVVAPFTRGIDQIKKMALYARSGVAEYWIADPDQRTLTIHVLEGDEYRVIAPGADGKLESRVLAGLRVDPVAVFARLD